MAFIISDIRNQTPQSEHRYFFDANIWLAILDVSYSKKELNPYINFFNSIINESHTNDASIAIPCLLLSEIINRMINDIHYKEFSINNPRQVGQTKWEHFKTIYRRSQDYKLDIEAVCASIRQYHRKIEFISDNLDKYSCRDLIKKIPTHLDINDYLYSKMALEQGLVIITYDKDFSVEDIHILTTQKPLLDLMK